VTRGTGKTLAMVKGLEPNSIVIIHSSGMRAYLENMLVDVRGLEFAKTIKIKVLSEQMIDELRGFHGTIAVDHWVYERSVDNLSRSERKAESLLHEFLYRRPIAK